MQSGAEAAAAGISWGHTDIDCGNQYNLSMQDALDANLTTFETIDVSLGAKQQRHFRCRFLMMRVQTMLGQDRLETTIPYQDISNK